MSKHNIFKMFSLVLIILIIAGCGNDSGASSTGDEGQSDDPLRAYEGTTLSVLTKTGYESAAITEFEGDFEELTGINLEVEVVDEQTLRNRFVLDVTSKTGAYDVVTTQFWSMPEFLQLGGLEPLNTYIEDKPSSFLALDQVPEDIVDTYRGEDGNLFALPVSASGGVLMYRKDIFEEHNIPIPKTTKDVIEAAKLVEEKLQGEVVPFVGRGNSSTDAFGSSAGWAAGYGASVLDSEGNVQANSEKMQEAMKDWVTLMRDYSTSDASAMGWDTMSEVFRQGGAAMNFDMSGFPSAYSDSEVSQVAGDVGVKTIVGPADEPAQWVYAEGLGINKYSENKGAAWLFLQWRTSLDVAKKEVNEGIRYDFPLTSVYEKDFYQEKTKELPFTDAFPEITKSIDTSYWPFVTQFDKVAQAFQEEISLSIAGEQDVETALKKAESKIKKILE